MRAYCYKLELSYSAIKIISPQTLPQTVRYRTVPKHNITTFMCSSGKIFTKVDMRSVNFFFKSRWQLGINNERSRDRRPDHLLPSPSKVRRQLGRYPQNATI